MDITQLILDDHHEQRRLFAIIESLSDTGVDNCVAVWKRLEAFLEVHALAEERIFYPALLSVGKGVGHDDGPVPETVDAIKDHNEIRDGVARVNTTKAGSPEWLRAISKLNKANGDHMAEEEREGLTDFRLNASLQLRYELAVEFAVFEANHVSGVVAHNVNPEAYIAQQAGKNK